MPRNTRSRELVALCESTWLGVCKEEQSTEWKEESSIPEALYDQQKKYEGFKDDREDRYEGQAFRHLTRWFLADSRHASVSRIALPRVEKHQKFTQHVCLYGELEPNVNAHGWNLCDDSKKKGRLKVVIRRLKDWVMDCSRSTRGVWVFSGHWYQLKQPDQTPVQLPDGRHISQEEVHLEMRAVFGLFSNMVDMLMELKQQTGEGLSITNYLASYHRKKSPQKSHAALCPSEGQKDAHSELNEVPFDLELLRREAQIIRYFLRNLDQEYLTTQSPFMRGLCQMEKDFRAAVKRAEQWAMGSYEYSASAEASELRSQQTPWGDHLPNARPVHPNRLLELDVPTSYDSSFSMNWAREHGLAPQVYSSIGKQYECKIPGPIVSSASAMKAPSHLTSCGPVFKNVGFDSLSSDPSIGKPFRSDGSSNSDESECSPDSDSSSSHSGESDSDRSSRSNPSQWDITEELDEIGLPGIDFSAEDQPIPAISGSKKRKRQKRKKAVRQKSSGTAKDKPAPEKPKRGRNQKARKPYVSAVDARDALHVIESYVLQGDVPLDLVKGPLVLIGEELLVKLHADFYEDTPGAKRGGGDGSNTPSEGRKYVYRFNAVFAIDKLTEHISASGTRTEGVDEALVLLQKTLGGQQQTS